MMVKGRAETKEAVCSPFNPLLAINTAVIPAINTPQITLTMLDGLSPSDVIMPRTKTAESAEVTRNMTIRTSISTDNNVYNGNSFNKTKMAVVTSCETASDMAVPWNKSMYNPVPPKMAIHTNPIAGGTTITPITNSLIVLPFQIRATRNRRKETRQSPMPNKKLSNPEPTFHLCMGSNRSSFP